ncbi:LUD domain-containing protein [Iodidimonas sp. SYSU 1G8]|uniref:LutC/YkgG family protein n=1 Tax=Iodidimonas sp. SYSU 1G8 TaxID=3133967 RepID=UPI0031FF16C8
MAADSRADILARLRRGAAPFVARATPSPPPASPLSPRARFIERLTAARTTTEAIPSLADAPAAVARYLAAQNLPARICLAPGLAGRMAFDTVTVEDALPVADGIAVLTDCVAAVAETGTFVAASGPGRDQRLNYLAETLIVIVGDDQIVHAYEEVWTRLRVRTGREAPRLVSFITGPSRTADIEQTIEWGAHGPRRLHVLVSDETP